MEQHPHVFYQVEHGAEYEGELASFYFRSYEVAQCFLRDLIVLTGESDWTEHDENFVGLGISDTLLYCTSEYEGEYLTLHRHSFQD